MNIAATLSSIQVGIPKEMTLGQTIPSDPTFTKQAAKPWRSGFVKSPVTDPSWQATLTKRINQAIQPDETKRLEGGP